MENYIEKYFSFVTERMNLVVRESGASIAQAAEAVASTIQKDGMFYLFGSGHSALTARDAAYRAGGLASALLIDDIAEGDAERLEGLAQYILARYDLHAGSAIAVISNSGINPTPIEVAMLTKQLGLTVIVITSLSHSQSVASRHSSGKKLYEVGDIVIDTHGVPGDAAIQLPNSQIKSGALSTVIGAAIVQAITVQTAAFLSQRGIKPPIWISANLPGGDENNNALQEKYRSRMARYQMALLPKFKPHR
jgi:uncharacterized phosphosugar-binding protein